jgi:hypothetical protein
LALTRCFFDFQKRTFEDQNAAYSTFFVGNEAFLDGLKKKNKKKEA